MQAQTLNCPNCGAAISSDSPQCKYCESQLATVACPSCFGMMFIGSRHCPHCGAAASQVSAADLPILKCPRCTLDMSPVMIGTTEIALSTSVPTCPYGPMGEQGPHACRTKYFEKSVAAVQNLCPVLRAKSNGEMGGGSVRIAGLDLPSSARYLLVNSYRRRLTSGYQLDNPLTAGGLMCPLR